MRESKYELTNWKKWKYISQLLKETKNQLKDMRRAIPIGADNMPGGNHSSVIARMQNVIEECDQYDILISYYDFMINRLERAIATLNKDERKVCIIFSNNPQNSDTREMEAIEKGYSRATFYRILDRAYIKLDELLCVDKETIIKDTEMTIEDYDRDIY